MLLRSFRIDPARGGDRIERLPFLSHGPVEVQLRSKLTFLIGENGTAPKEAIRLCEISPSVHCGALARSTVAGLCARSVPC